MEITVPCCPAVVVVALEAANDTLSVIATAYINVVKAECTSAVRAHEVFHEIIPFVGTQPDAKTSLAWCRVRQYSSGM